MANNGIQSANLTATLKLDEIIGNASGSTRRQKVEQFAAQLASSGPIAARISAAAGKWMSFATKPEMDADLSWPAGQEGRVYNDPGKGVYRKTGAPGAGAWTLLGPIPEADTSALEAAINDIGTEVGGLQLAAEGAYKFGPDVEGGFGTVIFGNDGTIVYAESKDGVRYEARNGQLLPIAYGDQAPGFRVGPDIEGNWGDELTFGADGRLVTTTLPERGKIDFRAGTASVVKVPRRYMFAGGAGLQLAADDVITMFLVIGQSLAQGFNDLATDATVTVAAEHPGAALMFDVGTRPGGRPVSGFVDLHEQLYFGSKETICSGMADVIMTGLNAALARKPQVLWAVAAEGGILYAGAAASTLGIKRGADQYAESVRLIRRATEIATVEGKRLVVAGIVLAHGETDTAVGTTRWQYRRALSQLRFDLEAEARAITGQIEPVRGYAYLPCRGSSVAGVPSQVAESILDVEDYDAGWRCVGPNYFAPDATGGGAPGDAGVDVAHPNARGYRRIGRMFGHAVLNDFFGPWFKAMRILDRWWVSDTVFALQYPYPVALEDDDSRITISTLGAGKGVDFTDGSGAPPAVTGIAVSGANNTVVEVTLASAPVGRRPRAFVASRQTASASGPVYGIRSGIRSAAAYDTDPTDGVSLYHWACPEHVDL